MFAITRFRYIEVLTIVLLGERKSFVILRTSFYIEVRYIEVPLDPFLAIVEHRIEVTHQGHICGRRVLLSLFSFLLLLLLLFFLEGLTSFSEITEDSDVASKMKEVYQDINNIDLWVGGLAEDHEEGSELGPTFRA